MRIGLAAFLAVLAAGAVLIVIDGGGASAPGERAAGLVPADALLYAHLSTDPDRDEDSRLAERLQRFPILATVQDRLRRSISRDLDLERDVRPWLGDEVAIALLDAGGARADSLLLLAVRDRRGADAFLTRAAGSTGTTTYRGVALRRFGPLAVAFAGGFMVIGQQDAVRTALDREQGRGPALAGSEPYLRARRGIADDRVLELYLPPAGVRRVLAAAPGLAGALGGLLDHPKLTGVSASVSPADGGVRLRVRQSRSGEAPREFEPTLLEDVPRDAVAYLGTAGLEAAGRLIPPAGAKQLQSTLGTALRGASLSLDRDVLAPLRGEVAISLTPGIPVPTLTLIAKTADERRTREALARLQQPVAELLTGAPRADGPAPAFDQRELGDTTAFVLGVTSGLELAYAVADGRVIISTQLNGVGRVLAERPSLGDTERFKRAVPEKPDRASAVLFVDLGQLLALAEQAGLTGDPAYLAIRDDLRKVRTAGAVVKREETDSTAELFFEIP